MLYITTLTLTLLSYTVAVDSNLRSQLDPIPLKQDFEEDEKFWEKRLQEILSTASPTTEPFPTTFPPSNGLPTTPPPSPQTTPTIPTRPPSQVVCQGITQLDRAQQLTEIALGASESIIPGSPQDVALEWLIQTDPYFVCPDDPKALQRYILAVFYFATDGDNWDECSAPVDFTNPNAINAANRNCNVLTTPIPGGVLNPAFLPTTEGTSAWLTPVYECEWAGITCRVDTTCVDRVEFGE